MREHLELFTDGGAIRIGNKFYGSLAYVIKFKNRFFKFTDPVNEGTNNYYELKAIRDGLRAIVTNWQELDNVDVWIVSDSQYSLSCITEWFPKWKKINGVYYNTSKKPVANIELIIEIRELLKMIPHYRFVKIKSHIDCDIEETYNDFKKKNKLQLSYADYLVLVKFNEICDIQIRNAFNLKRKALAERNNVDVI